MDRQEQEVEKGRAEGRAEGRPDPKARTEADALSRRSFLTSVGLATAGVAAVGLSACSPASESPTSETSGASEAAVTELPIPEATIPTTTEYEVDVLVVGGGFAGISAAVRVKEEGKSVLLVDKAHPGYSGCSPYAQCYQFFSEEYGDDREMQYQACMQSGEYIANLDWYNVYLDESHDAAKRLMEWGIYEQITKASEEGLYEEDEKVQWEYHDKHLDVDRRVKWMNLLTSKEIPFVDHTMVTDVITNNGRVIGAVGLHNASGTVITFHAKAVILCVGIGSYRNAGFPLGPNTFDGEWIAYQAGIPITGKEWDHFEATNSVTPSSSWRNYSWGYLENIHFTAGVSVISEDASVENTVKAVVGRVNTRIKAALGGIEPIDINEISTQGLNAPVNRMEDDPRTGNNVDDMPKRDIIGASVGMGCFKNNGVFCGIDDLVGYTGLPGLYAAGDCLASMVYGATYYPGQGGSVVLSQIQGEHAASDACAYANSVQLEKIDSATMTAKEDELTAPLYLETGLDPHWARDVLHSIMAPYWVAVIRSEETLNSALAQVEYIKENVLPILIARNAHDLRLVHETKHRLLSAEMKLRASLERKESRGAFYRSDYPYRNDEFLCYITLSKGSDGNMVVNRAAVKDEWKGDVTLDYASRYIVRFPGEAAAQGLPEAG